MSDQRSPVPHYIDCGAGAIPIYSDGLCHDYSWCVGCAR